MTHDADPIVLLPRSYDGWLLPQNPWLSHRGDRLTRAEKIAAKPEFTSIIDQDLRDYLAECRKADPLPVALNEPAWKRALQDFRFKAGEFIVFVIFPLVFLAALVAAALFAFDNSKLKEQRRDDLAFRREMYLYSQALVQQGRQMRADPLAAPNAPEPPDLVDALARLRERNEVLRQRALERRAAAALAGPAVPAVVEDAAEAPPASAQPTP